ncbi:hypothetical protein PCASD_22132 [Puccinia coronata f. sp. avenae]|uniref:Mannosyltransferase n=1 Tax=Puccinia coronata f. sp. avenae TaxID=200324 RepID=A0A2N5TNU9_9BASI|nr:hypothetical protein PCASD_22132 [Puccinia coronata f. sp. avenae]
MSTTSPSSRPTGLCSATAIRPGSGASPRTTSPAGSEARSTLSSSSPATGYLLSSVWIITPASLEGLDSPQHSHRKVSATRWQLACSLTSFFNACAGIRTLSNSLEAALTASALAFWPWNPLQIHSSWINLSIAILLIALSVIVRPSSLLFWSLLGYTLIKRSNGETCMDIMALVTVIGVISALLCFWIDSSFYGIATFTPLNFVRRNVVQDISTFYGVNRFHFYFTQAFPFVNFAMSPTVILGMAMLSTPQNMHESLAQLTRLRSARVAVLGTMVGLLSLLKHKEFRFIQPLVPLFKCFAARAMVNNYIKHRQAHPATSPTDLSPLERLLAARPIGFILRALISLAAAFYLLSFHYRAQVSVIHYLRHLPDHELRSVGFLMPCHSTPWQSHLHKPHLASNGSQERLWMLTCEPPLIPFQLVALLSISNPTLNVEELKKNVEAFMGVSKATERSIEETMSTPLPGETLKLLYDRTRETRGSRDGVTLRKSHALSGLAPEEAEALCETVTGRASIGSPSAPSLRSELRKHPVKQIGTEPQRMLLASFTLDLQAGFLDIFRAP